MKKEFIAKILIIFVLMTMLAWLLMTTDVLAQSRRYEMGLNFTDAGRKGQLFLDRLPSSLVGKEIYDESLPPADFAKDSPYDGETNLYHESTSLTWFSSEGATSYEYCYDTSDDDACSTWVSTGTATEVTLSGLTPATTYYWQVRAVNTGGTTYANGETGYWQFTTLFPPGPSDFEKYSPRNGETNLYPDSITLEWFMSNGASYYEYCYDTSDDDACENWISAGSATEVTPTGLAAATTYYWQVRSVNLGGTVYADQGRYWYFTTVNYIYYLPLMVNE